MFDKTVRNAGFEVNTMVIMKTNLFTKEMYVLVENSWKIILTTEAKSGL
jgi:hypothetical protein